MAENNAPKSNGPTERPMSTVAWIIFFFVMLLPGLNLIVILFAAFGPVNLNLKYFSRAVLIWMILMSVIFGAIGFFTWRSFTNRSHEEQLQFIDDAHKTLDTIKDSLQQQWKEEGNAKPAEK